MIRVINAHTVVRGQAKYYEFAGTSDDTKPTEGIATGSLFHEVDTKKVYAFNEDASSGEEWVEQMTLSEE